MNENQSHQSENLVFRLSQELALQLIEHMENIRDDNFLTIQNNFEEGTKDRWRLKNFNQGSRWN